MQHSLIPLRVAPSPWRTLLIAAIWLVVASIGIPVFVGLVIGFVATIGGTRGPSVLEAPGGLLLVFGLGLLTTQITLLLVARRGARRLVPGDVNAGLGNVAMRGWRPALIGILLVAMWVAALSIAIRRIPGFRALLPSVDAAAAGHIGDGAVIWQVLLGVGVVVLAPLGEEVFFRGWLWTALRQRWSLPATGTATALLFLIAHVTDGPMRPILLIPTAIILTCVRQYGGSVRASFIVHMFNNLTAVVLEPLIASLFR